MASIQSNLSFEYSLNFFPHYTYSDLDFTYDFTFVDLIQAYNMAVVSADLAFSFDVTPSINVNVLSHPPYDSTGYVSEPWNPGAVEAFDGFVYTAGIYTNERSGETEKALRVDKFSKSSWSKVVPYEFRYSFPYTEDIFSAAIFVDSEGFLHVLSHSLYAYRDLSGSWTSGEYPNSTSPDYEYFRGPAVITSDDTLYVFARDSVYTNRINVRKSKGKGDSWSVVSQLEFASSLPGPPAAVVVDSNEDFHLFLPDGTYLSSQRDGDILSWTNHGLVISPAPAYSTSPPFENWLQACIGADDTIHVFYRYGTNIFYTAAPKHSSSWPSGQLIYSTTTDLVSFTPIVFSGTPGGETIVCSLQPASHVSSPEGYLIKRPEESSFTMVHLPSMGSNAYDAGVMANTSIYPKSAVKRFLWVRRGLLDVDYYEIFNSEIGPIDQLVFTSTHREAYVPGELVTISWDNTIPSVDAFDILYSKDDGATWEGVVARDLDPSTSSYVWQVPADSTDEGRLKLVARSGAREIASIESERFSIDVYTLASVPFVYTIHPYKDLAFSYEILPFWSEGSSLSYVYAVVYTETESDDFSDNSLDPYLIWRQLAGSWDKTVVDGHVRLYGTGSSLSIGGFESASTLGVKDKYNGRFLLALDYDFNVYPSDSGWTLEIGAISDATGSYAKVVIAYNTSFSSLRATVAVSGGAGTASTLSSSKGTVYVWRYSTSGQLKIIVVEEDGTAHTLYDGPSFTEAVYFQTLLTRDGSGGWGTWEIFLDNWLLSADSIAGYKSQDVSFSYSVSPLTAKADLLMLYGVGIAGNSLPMSYDLFGVADLPYFYSIYPAASLSFGYSILYTETESDDFSDNSLDPYLEVDPISTWDISVVDGHVRLYKFGTESAWGSIKSVESVGVLEKYSGRFLLVVDYDLSSYPTGYYLFWDLRIGVASEASGNSAYFRIENTVTGLVATSEVSGGGASSPKYLTSDRGTVYIWRYASNQLKIILVEEGDTAYTIYDGPCFTDAVYFRAIVNNYSPLSPSAFEIFLDNWVFSTDSIAGYRSQDLSFSYDTLPSPFISNDLPVSYSVGGVSSEIAFFYAIVPIPTPSVSDVVVTPTEPEAGVDTLKLTYTYTDPLDLPEGGTLIHWYRNGAHDKRFDHQKEVPGSYTVEGDSWYAVVTPGNGFVYGESVKSNEVTILAAAPPVPYAVTIYPRHPMTGDDLYLVVQGGSGADYFEIEWYKDEKRQVAYDNKFRVDGFAVKAGETWSARVRAVKGNKKSEWMES